MPNTAVSAGRIITVNGGSSSIRFAVFDAAGGPTRLLGGIVERVGSAGATLVASDPDGRAIDRQSVAGAGPAAAVDAVAAWLADRLRGVRVHGVGHRIVHGGARLVEHQRVTDAVLGELRAARPLDPAHLPGEIALLEAFAARFAGVPQVACFDAAFHRQMPRAAQLLPIPRRYDDAGIRRLGFHGLSYTFLMGELRRVAGPAAADGRVILAHLGSGASLAAVRGGAPIDTSMGFTPASGLVMGTRPGDLDPGLLLHLMREEGLDLARMDAFINTQCGLAGVSGTGSDMRDLIARRAADVRAAEAVDLFCYQAKKWVGAFAAALGGLDTLVFSGGIGERAPDVRAAICDGLGFLGLTIDRDRNARSAAVISADAGRVVVRVMPSDEEVVIARAVARLVESGGPDAEH